MLKFVFLLTMYSADGTPPAASVEAANLTGEACAAMVQEYVADHPTLDRGFPSCEPDLATGYTVEHNGERIDLPECQAEDSDNCVWDGMHHGNGMGRSFYVLNGVVYYLD